MADRARTIRVAGHFGEMLQGRLGPGGPVALVTLPCAALTVAARWTPARGLSVHTPDRLITLPEVRAIARALGRPPGGRLTLRAGMPPGGGSGASTAARLATARVLAGRPLPAGFLERLALALEGASDPLMHADAGCLLWAPRLGRTLAVLPAPPAFDVVGGYDGPGRRTDPADTGFADVSDLVALWAEAADAGDRTMLAGLTTESAARNTELRGGPALDALSEVGRRHGALGIVAAHTGSARGLLFEPAEDRPMVRRDLRAIGLHHVLSFRTAGARG